MENNITIQICVSVDVSFYENRSGISIDEVAKKVCDCVMEERSDLAMEAKILAIRLLAGENID